MRHNYWVVRLLVILFTLGMLFAMQSRSENAALMCGGFVGCCCPACVVVVTPRHGTCLALGCNRAANILVYYRGMSIESCCFGRILWQWNDSTNARVEVEPLAP